MHGSLTSTGAAVCSHVKCIELSCEELTVEESQHGAAGKMPCFRSSGFNRQALRLYLQLTGSLLAPELQVSSANFHRCSGFAGLSSFRSINRSRQKLNRGRSSAGHHSQVSTSSSLSIGPVTDSFHIRPALSRTNQN